MKHLLLLLVFSSSSIFAQSTLSTKNLKNIGLGLSTEIETETIKNSDNDIAGTKTFFLAEPSLKLSANQKLSMPVQYALRTNESTKLTNTRDYMEEAGLKYSYKALKSSESLIDLKLQARAYYNADPLFRDYYGNNGNYQMRAYFGRPIVGRLELDKYVSYVRFKKYMTNDEAGSRTRDYEYRLRVSPAYSFSDALKAGITITYNQKIEIDNDKKEEIDLGASVRYAFGEKGKYAFLLMSDYTPYETNKNGKVAKVDSAIDEVTYRLNFSANIL